MKRRDAICLFTLFIICATITGCGAKSEEVANVAATTETASVEETELETTEHETATAIEEEISQILETDIVGELSVTGATLESETDTGEEICTEIVEVEETPAAETVPAQSEVPVIAESTSAVAPEPTSAPNETPAPAPASNTTGIVLRPGTTVLPDGCEYAQEYTYNGKIYGADRDAWVNPADGMIYNVCGPSDFSICYGTPGQIIMEWADNDGLNNADSAAKIQNAVNIYREQFNHFFLGTGVRTISSNIMDDETFYGCLSTYGTNHGIANVTYAAAGVNSVPGCIEAFLDTYNGVKLWYISVPFADTVSGNLAWIEFPMYIDGTLAPLTYLGWY